MACKCSATLVLRLSGRAKQAVEKMATHRNVPVEAVGKIMIGTQLTIDKIIARGGKILILESGASRPKEWLKFK